ncbi:MAG: hypothetical protein ACOYON_09140 [Fimbriimonas sp.]
MSYLISKSIYASFADPKQAEKAGGALLDHGVKAHDLSIMFPEGFIAEGPVLTDAGENLEHEAKTGISTTTRKDAEIGSAKGAGFGLLAGTLAALAAVFVPGVGLVLGGGAIAIAIAGMAGTTAAGAVAGGVTGYLVDQNIPAEFVLDYQRILTGGGAFVTVTPMDEGIDSDSIEAVLVKYGGTISTYPQDGSDVPKLGDEKLTALVN